MADDSGTLYPPIAPGQFITFGPPQSVTVTTSNTTVLQYNPTRTYLLLVNSGATDCYVSIGFGAVSTAGIFLKNGGGSYEMNLGSKNVSPQSVFAVTASGTTNLTFIEGT